MEKIDFYLQAATRQNTHQSYESAIRHYEMEWKGLLPATGEDVANYLVHYAEQLSINTLRQRVSALSQWHCEQGFPDPTKSTTIKKILKGIKSVHQTQEKQAKPLTLKDLYQVIHHIDTDIDHAQQNAKPVEELRLLRNKAFILLGFWRGFRGDELTRLVIENIQITPQQGMICYLGQTKGDRENKGQYFKVPALAELCPVQACQDWLAMSKLTQGPLFRKIHRYGQISDHGFHIDSLIPVLRQLLTRANIPNPELYTTHSLRRGFANWANQQGWDLKTLMQYVGWKNVSSAMRYIDSQDFDFSTLALSASNRAIPLKE